MKTSGKLILFLLIFFVVIIAVSAVFVRSTVKSVISIDKTGPAAEDADRTRQDREFDVSGFSSVEMRGVWSSVITKGDGYSVRVSAPAYVYDNLDIRKNGGTLVLDMDKFSFAGFSNNDIRVEVVCPDLKSLKAEGASTIKLKNFDSSNLDVELDGTVSITGTGNRIGRLSLRADGAIHVDLKDSLVKDADIRMDGASGLQITMDGGVLDGEINGLGSVEYYGETRDERIRANGLASVKRR